MSVKRITSRYAKSLIDLAKERGQLEAVHADVQLFNEVSKNKDFGLLVKSPIVKADKKRKIFDAIFNGKVTELTTAFLNIVLTKGRESFLPAIMDEFVLQYKILQNISSVKITSAAPLSAEAIEEIKLKLIAERAISANVDITTAVDPSLLGGFVLEFNDQLYDASVARKLNTLKKDFSGNLYVSQIVA